MDNVADIKMCSDEHMEALAKYLANYYMVDWVLCEDSSELIVSYYDNSNVEEVMKELTKYDFIKAAPNGKIIVKGDYAKLDHLADRIDWHYD